MALKIGVDVGGTNTDAVLIEGEKLISQVKTTTTSDITTGIVSAISQLVEGVDSEKISRIASVNVGTTHLLNACIQDHAKLNKVMVIRLAGKSTTAYPPCSDWPQEVRESLVGDERFIASGGYEYNGEEISFVDPEEISWVARRAAAEGIHHIAVSGVFANVNPAQEEEVRRIVQQIDPSISVTVSNEIGGLGLIPRENATIINAGSMDLFKRIQDAFQRAVDELSLNSAKVFITYGDGTKTLLGDESKPLKTLHSGPANSILGGEVLTKLGEAVTVDIGGTSSDVGLLCQGEPMKENSSFPITGLGVTCNFVLPRTHSFGLGGGTIIGYEDGIVTVGPKSVGHQLESQAVIFGGDVLTTTDIAVALDRLKVGTHDREIVMRKIAALAPGKDVNEVLAQMDEAIHQKLVEGIRHTLSSIEKIPPHLVLAGGGASLFDVAKLEELLSRQFASIVIPPSHGIANALGAAMSKIGAKITKVYDYAKMARDEALRQAEQEARELAVAKGADPTSIKLAEVSEVQINYLDGQPHEISVNVVGSEGQQQTSTRAQIPAATAAATIPVEAIRGEKPLDRLGIAEAAASATRMLEGSKLLTVENIKDISIGAGLLGSGGGGSPALGRQLAMNAIEQGKNIHSISLENLPDDASVVVLGVMGSPVVLDERPPSLEEGVQAIRQLEAKSGKKIDAVVLLEIGGTNGTYPLALAAKLGIPVVDADCMGRALPGINMITPNIEGDLTGRFYAALSNGRESALVEADEENFASLERKAREATAEMGGIVSIAYVPMSGAEAKTLTIPNTLSTAQRMGQAVREAEKQPMITRIAALNRVLASTDYKEAEKVFEGKISRVVSSEDSGFNIGGFFIEDPATGETVEVGFQNENLIARNRKTGQILAQVPELITIVDRNTMQVISCGEYRYGQEVVVLKMSPPKQLMTAKAIPVVGPGAYPMEKIDQLLEQRVPAVS